MKTDSEGPYRVAITAATTLRHPPHEFTDRHLRALAHELAEAVTDLDARLRAGLPLPTAWHPAEPDTHRSR